jgi:hypothetical protein
MSSADINSPVSSEVKLPVKVYVPAGLRDKPSDGAVTVHDPDSADKDNGDDGERV